MGVDPAHSTVEFAVKHMGLATVRGRFNGFEGILEVAEDLPRSRASGKVMVASITTDDANRDAHLRSPDFFGAERLVGDKVTISLDISAIKQS